METAARYMIALSPSERTDNVKAMVEAILRDAENAIAEADAEGWSEGFAEGFDRASEADSE